MKKIKGMIVMLLISLSFFGLGGCKEAPTYEQISQETAKSIMDTQKDYIIIDARTDEEFEEGHIEGAIMIPEYEIAKRDEKERNTFKYTIKEI